MSEETTFPPTLPKNDHSTPSIETAVLRSQILKMRVQSVSFPDIAEHFGMTQGYIYKQYKTALRDIYREDAEQLRQITNERLSQLWGEAELLKKSFTPLVSAGSVVMDHIRDSSSKMLVDSYGEPTGHVVLEDIGPKFKGIEVQLKIIERHSKMNGLDLPSKIALTDPDGKGSIAGAVIYLPDNSRAINNV